MRLDEIRNASGIIIVEGQGWEEVIEEVKRRRVNLNEFERRIEEKERERMDERRVMEMEKERERGL